MKRCIEGQLPRSHNSVMEPMHGPQSIHTVVINNEIHKWVIQDRPQVHISNLTIIQLPTVIDRSYLKVRVRPLIKCMSKIFGNIHTGLYTGKPKKYQGVKFDPLLFPVFPVEYTYFRLKLANPKNSNLWCSACKNKVGVYLKKTPKNPWHFLIKSLNIEFFYKLILVICYFSLQSDSSIAYLYYFDLKKRKKNLKNYCLSIFTIFIFAEISVARSVSVAMFVNMSSAESVSISMSVSLSVIASPSPCPWPCPSMSVAEIVFVTVSVPSCPSPLSFQSRSMSVSVLCPWTGPPPYIFERVTVRVVTCIYVLSGYRSMHDHVSVNVSVNVRFRVRDHFSVRIRCHARFMAMHARVRCRLCLRPCWWPCQFPWQCPYHVRDHVRVRIE